MVGCGFLSMPLAMLILLLAALAGGYWLGRRPRREGERTGFGIAPDEEPEIASPATAVASAPAGIAPVSSNLYDFETLSSLSVSGCWQLKLECNAPENYCRVTAESSLWKEIRVEMLPAGLAVRYTGKLRPTLPMTIEIRTKGQPSQLKGRGANTLTVEHVHGNQFSCKVSDGGRLLMPEAELDEFKLKLSGSARAEIGGAFTRADLDVSGSSTAKCSGPIRRAEAAVSGASRLELASAERADLEISGASRVKIDVSERLEGDVSGASTLHYSGAVKKPALRVSGSSRAERAEK